MFALSYASDNFIAEISLFYLIASGVANVSDI